jgi:hypothetical protein
VQLALHRVACLLVPLQVQQQMTPEQYQEALKQTEPLAFAGAAATVAASPSTGVVADPSLTDCILCVSHGSSSCGLS